jgi:hypothetical protein
MLSLSSSITLSNYVGQKLVFNVPVHDLDGTDPIISEIRAYDSSTNIRKFNVINCDETITPVCCGNMTESIQLTNGVASEDRNMTSVLADPPTTGTLCWNTFTNSDMTSTYNLVVENTSVLITMGINATITSENNVVRYTDSVGNCYQGTLSSTTENNILVNI